MDGFTDTDIPSSSTTIVSPLAKTHTHTIIFLHGREDYGSDLTKIFFDSKSSNGQSLAEILPTVKWVFPTAKLRYSAQRDFEFSSSSFAESLKGEEIISQWFDVWYLDKPDEKQELMIPGIRESVGDIIGIVREESRLVSKERIVLGGISQGCATGILTLLASGLHLAGFVGLSSWLPFRRDFENIPVEFIIGYDLRLQTERILQITKFVDEARQVSEKPSSYVSKDLEASLSKLSLSPRSSVKTPVFLSHSRDDETVLFTHGKSLFETMRKLGFDVRWKVYEDGGHWIHPKHGVDDISAFLRKVWDK